MRLIVVGASGMIGNAVFKMAQRRGIEVFGTASHAGNEQYYPLDLLQYGLQGLKRILAAGKASETVAVIAAGQTNMKYCYEHRELSYQINVKNMENLLLTLYQRGIKTLYLSSDAVFDGESGGYKENSSKKPLTIYGRQKSLVETFIKENIPDGLVYRLAKIIDDRPLGNHLYAELYRRYMDNKPFCCIKGLTFNPTCLHDVAECIFLGVERKLSGVYHVANQEIFTREALSHIFISYRDESYPIYSTDLCDWDFQEPKPLNTTMHTEKFQKAVGGYQFTSADELAKKFWDRIGDESRED